MDEIPKPWIWLGASKICLTGNTQPVTLGMSQLVGLTWLQMPRMLSLMRSMEGSLVTCGQGTVNKPEACACEKAFGRGGEGQEVLRVHTPCVSDV